MIAYTLDDGVHAAVSDAETLTGDAPDVNLPGCAAIEGDVADDDTLFGEEG